MHRRGGGREGGVGHERGKLPKSARPEKKVLLTASTYNLRSIILSLCSAAFCAL